MDTTLEQKLLHYAESHRNRRNVLIHCVCVPAIVFAVVGGLVAINPVVAGIALIAAVIYYAFIDPDRMVALRAAAAMAAVLAAMLALWTLVIPPSAILPLALGIFVIAWIGQFVGHHIEGRKPSFFDDLRYLLVGPLFVMHEMLPGRRQT
ncbi:MULTISPECIES: DUF962 domain-containing protein [Acidiphilium]|jgi:uncharacterized membrane protein YGL010W|uniref:PRS2 protein n=1 Tax=Acidiphilium multivorum (strain DSM 11245 / JCM 8867 / NBRC 100883 / AIU 301) TaxID=926570 RepID=F0IZT5_ACIMA|nr:MULTISPECIES: TSUP family transporter [Acidiphilium]MBU6357719.1 DUF962 domain-containing protein [Rhodospirillales bacterium]EGO93560.1 Membrane protein [Acidiphilium sp. PM]UNC14865.1 DUF962 domain-containing protein [Acidiphilium multivorum]BAJ81295.1 hypothetical protein ACMV_19480 [Acidiphilium multivorum AIU301]GAN74393.1 hypothetical protein Apmu_0164_06 [Acidiphilium multivorum AIU301]